MKVMPGTVALITFGGETFEAVCQGESIYSTENFPSYDFIGPVTNYANIGEAEITVVAEQVPPMELIFRNKRQAVRATGMNVAVYSALRACFSWPHGIALAHSLWQRDASGSN